MEPAKGRLNAGSRSTGRLSSRGRVGLLRVWTCTCTAAGVGLDACMSEGRSPAEWPWGWFLLQRIEDSKHVGSIFTGYTHQKKKKKEVNGGNGEWSGPEWEVVCCGVV